MGERLPVCVRECMRAYERACGFADGLHAGTDVEEEEDDHCQLTCTDTSSKLSVTLPG